MTSHSAPAAITAAGATPGPTFPWTQKANSPAACPARPGGHRWQMAITDGAVTISCGDCGDEPFPDYAEMIVMGPVPVRIEEVSHHRDGQCPLPPDVGCDCGSDLKATLIPEGSEA